MQDSTWIFQSTRENCDMLRQIWLRETSSHCWRWVCSASCFLKAGVIVTPKWVLARMDTCNVKCLQTTENRRGGLWWSTYPDGSFSHHKKSIMTLSGWLFGRASPRLPVWTCFAANLACEERSSTSAKPSTIIKTEISNVMEPSKRRQNRLMFQFQFLPVTSC